MRFLVVAACLLAAAGCAETGVKTAQRQADAAAKKTPVEVRIQAPFDAGQAKAALAGGNLAISGVLYHRLTVSGREDNSWPKDPNVKNTPMRGITVLLYPATEHVAELERLFHEQRKIMERWYTGSRGALVTQPQTKVFPLAPEANLYVRSTKTDAFGRYRFDDLKPGAYYVAATGWQSGTYNRSVHAGTAEVTDGTGIHGYRMQVDRTKLVPVDFKTYLAYIERVNAGDGADVVDSRMRVDYNEMSVRYD